MQNLPDVEWKVSYSERNALDTIIFALRNDIIKFEEIISSEASD